VPAEKPKISMAVNDDRSFQTRKAYNLIIGTPFSCDESPKQIGKWWTVTILSAPYLLRPVTFHYVSEADAVLLIANIKSKLNSTTIASKGLSAR